MNDDRINYSNDAINVLRGLCMGAADIVPGVSGGTVALILGHYERLISAIANFNGRFINLIRGRQYAEALRHVDFRFLVALGIGMGGGIVGLASLMHFLLSNHQAYVYALFAGMILASSHLVAGRMKQWNISRVVLLIIGAVVAWQICILTPMHNELNPLSAFLAAVIAICAMILPGISGAFVLLVLGFYHPITELLRGLTKGNITIGGLMIIACFCAGCLIGLLSFSRLLRWLLKHRHDATMAFLVGLMFGSLYKIWPFQKVTEATMHLPFKEQQFELVLPSDNTASLLPVLILVVLGSAATLLMESIGKRVQSVNESGH